MADFNVSVTMSSELVFNDIPASSTNNFIISNPNAGSSYFVLETLANSNGAYDSNSPKNLQGTLSGDSGITGIVSDDYKAGIVVAPGGGTFTFVPDNTITTSSLKLRGTGPANLPFRGMLSNFPGELEAVFSVRRINDNYNGPLLRVRSGSTEELNIGFTPNGDLDTATLLSFVGTSTDDHGYVTKWYDQSGKARHVSQPTQGAQPVIVLSGSLNVTGSENRPSILGFQSPASHFESPVIDLTASFSIFAVYSSHPGANGYLLHDEPIVGDNYVLLRSNNVKIRASGSYEELFTKSGTNLRGSHNLYNIIFTPLPEDSTKSSGSINVNGELFATGSGPSGSTPLQIEIIGGDVDNNAFKEYQELIIYSNDQTANSSSFENQINEYFGIYS